MTRYSDSITIKLNLWHLLKAMSNYIGSLQLRVSSQRPVVSAFLVRILQVQRNTLYPWNRLEYCRTNIGH